MAKVLSILVLTGLAQLGTATQPTPTPSSSPIPVSKTPVGASDPIPEAFVSFSIEFAFFPDFAGGFALSIPISYSHTQQGTFRPRTGSRITCSTILET
jgi:hypothetical protein